MLLMEQGESVMLVTEAKYHNRGRNKARTKLIRRGKTKYHPKATSRKNPSVCSVKRNDT